MGVDTDAFSRDNRVNHSGDIVTIGYCGKYSEHKGLRELLDAVRQARSTSGIDFRLELLGRGPLEEYLDAISRSDRWLSVQPYVPNDEVPAFMHTLDIYVLPALIYPDHQEHDGHALLQAMSAGVAAIGTRSGIIPEILTPDTGILVPPGDVSSLASAIETLGADEELRNSYGINASKRVAENYSLDQVAGRRADQYLEVIDGY